MRFLRPICAMSRPALALAALLVLAACGGSSNADAAATSPESAGESAASATAATAETDESSDATTAQTLAEYLGPVGRAGQGFGAARGGGLDDTEAAEQQQLIQQAIQVCMQAQGFTYVPEAVGDGLAVFVATQNQGSSAADYAATEGFGISTRFDAILEGDFEFDDSEDPNDEYLATLSDGEADAWELALQGEPPQRNDQGQLIDPTTGEVLQRNRPGQATGGCQGSAQTEVRGQTIELGDLEDDLAVLADRIDSDPRVVQIQREWVDCMRAEGFDYTDEAEARADMNEQVRPLIRSFFAGSDGAQQAGPGPGQGGGGNFAQVVSGLQLTAGQEAELEVLQDLERSVAVASLSCQGDTGAEIAEITAAYEAEFIETNRAALEALGS